MEPGVHQGQAGVNKRAAHQRFLQQHIVLYKRPPQVVYPQMQAVLVNEYQEEGYIAKAFPRLFPSGAAEQPASRACAISPAEYFSHLIRYRDGRFASDPRFVLFALKTKYRWFLGGTASYFMKRGHSEMVTVAELREQIYNPLAVLGQSLCRFAAGVPGLAPY